ncbi:VWA domain-containing protein [Streptomyces arboris]|uniref:VWA domain-containing protein n=1 Tax=Streptomyces arboris TaxID=2600619 RepID=A0A5N5EN40_9ACTN|nr:VWA domain-containing protein [Streptomyces arboris]KAB2591793.1 VWA domain-containing protein [Streptomyces arboris]
MTSGEVHPLKGGPNLHKGRIAASVAAHFSGVRRNSIRVVLALPGAHRHPFQDGTVADMVRRAAVLGEVMSPTSDVSTCTYTSQVHRLPSLRLSDAERWIADWGVLPRAPLLSRDAVPGNLLTQHAERYALFGAEDPGEAVKEIAQNLPEGDAPTLVLFFFWGLRSEGTALADQLDAASGHNVFWQFLGDPGLGSSVLGDLDALRAEAPHIRNVSLYRGWELIEETPEYLLYRGVLKPFTRWRKER